MHELAVVLWSRLVKDLLPLPLHRGDHPQSRPEGELQFKLVNMQMKDERPTLSALKGKMVIKFDEIEIKAKDAHLHLLYQMRRQVKAVL